MDIEKYLNENSDSKLFLIVLLEERSSLIFNSGSTIKLSKDNFLSNIKPIHRENLKEQFEDACMFVTRKKLDGEIWQVEVIAFPTFKK